MKRKYQSELLGVIYEDALADFAVGAISEEELHEYERDCLAANHEQDELEENSIAKKELISAY